MVYVLEFMVYKTVVFSKLQNFADNTKNFEIFRLNSH